MGRERVDRNTAYTSVVTGSSRGGQHCWGVGGGIYTRVGGRIVALESSGGALCFGSLLVFPPSLLGDAGVTRAATGEVVGSVSLVIEHDEGRMVVDVFVRSFAL